MPSVLKYTEIYTSYKEISTNRGHSFIITGIIPDELKIALVSSIFRLMKKTNFKITHQYLFLLAAMVLEKLMLKGQ